QFSTLDDLLDDQEYVSSLSRYHVLTKAIHSNDFPFGAFPDRTLSDDLLTVSFIIGSDSSYYKINNQADVVNTNTEVSNGFIHIIGSVLQPVAYTSYEWLASRPEYSIFKEAVDITGTRALIDLDLKAPGQESVPPVTVLAESNDTLLSKYDISSLNELIERISPENDDYTNPSNPFYNFVGYHIIKNNYYLDDFQDEATNYNTNSEVPLFINGNGNDIGINLGKTVLDTIIEGQDTTFIDYVGFVYDQSNVITKSGSIHVIDRLLEIQPPSRPRVTLQFREEPVINDLRNNIGTYLLDDYKEDISRLEWTADELFFVKEGNESNASRDDYILTEGDFSIRYTIPQIVQGRYELIIRANSYYVDNALVEVFLDGNKIGSTVDLTRGGSAARPFSGKNLGIITFNNYSEHLVEIKSLIPGRFSWDYIRFTPI
ncbi:MAG TPA: fasciclin domain-containing protein, partial [Bacteroidales bacterium]|nr:fasciclin domain-containing protein [Bacteroidales bacterium]